ncbi:hypothetical protein I317_06802 [Kwoniella heveanensis CBS 569]|nr:hypothetical protein I317_06802 [Kwoniella heveanensis CBS 569]
MFLSPSRRNRFIFLAVICSALLFFFYPSTDNVYEHLSSHLSRHSTPCLNAIQHQRQVLLSSYGKSLSGVTHIALLDVPWHHNSGDSAIWLGELSLLEALGIEVRYMSTYSDYNQAEMDKSLEDIPEKNVAIMLHGGGNFGDIWGGHQEFRNRMMYELKDRKIRHFPQTFEFNVEKPSKLFKDSIKAYSSHPDVEVIARDSESYEYFLEHFQGVPVKLTPDAALFIGYNQNSVFTPPIMRAPGTNMRILDLGGRMKYEYTPAPSPYAGLPESERNPFGWPLMSFAAQPETDVLIVARGDKEGGQSRQDVTMWAPGLKPYEVVVKDWDDDWGRIQRPKKANSGLTDNGVPGGTTNFLDYWTQASLLRVQWAMVMITSGKIIISDRLHTNIMAILLGNGHVVVESGHLRKVEKVSNTWLSSCLISPAELEDIAQGKPRTTDANTVFVHEDHEAIEAAKALLQGQDHGVRWSRVVE